MPYEVRRDGSPMTVEVTWAVPSIGSALIEGWGFVVFSIAFGAVGAFVFARRPDEPAAIPLLFIASAAAGSSVPWFLGSSVSDIVLGPQFLLFALLTGPLYMLLWPAALHLAFVFPYRLPALERRPWLIPAAYLAGLARISRSWSAAGWSRQRSPSGWARGRLRSSPSSCRC